MHTVHFYETPSGRPVIREWLRSFDKPDRERLGYDLKRIQIGFPMGLPLCRSLGGGLWEVRSSLEGNREVRMIFFHDPQQKMLVVVHGFIKKSQKTPKAEIEIASRRMKGVQPLEGVLMTETRFRDMSGFSTLDDFLDEDGIREEVTLRAVKSVIALQLQQAIKAQGLTRAAMAAEMETSRAQLNRVLDPEASNVTLETLSRAARVLGRGLKGELV